MANGPDGEKFAMHAILETRGPEERLGDVRFIGELGHIE
jgi:hypothetical protein